MASGAHGENLIIYYNDCIDSDNMAAALALQRAMHGVRGTRVLWILEPRQVALGLAMTGAQIKGCQGKIKEYFPTLPNPFKVLLGGLLSEKDIAGVPEADRELLHLAVKPPSGPIGDAILHGRLTAWDLATALAQRASAPVEVLVDVDSLEHGENPVNLNMHHHEELVARSKEEVLEYQSLMEKPTSERVEGLRGWYRKCIDRASSRDNNRQCSVKDLDFSALCKAVEEAKAVRFLGGSSLWTLQRFIEKDLAHLLQCHLQVGSMDLSMNLFPNQFNVALNRQAAQFVLQNTDKFSKFIVVPSHTAQNLKYPLPALQEQGGRSLGKKMLGFNWHADPLKIATEQVNLQMDEYSQKAFPMPDLTAFLCALLPDVAAPSLGFVRVDDTDNVLIFKPDVAGISMYDIKESSVLGADKVADIFGKLDEGRSWLDLD